MNEQGGCLATQETDLMPSKIPGAAADTFNRRGGGEGGGGLLTPVYKLTSGH